MEKSMYDTLLQLPLFQGLCKNDFTNIIGKVKFHFLKHTAGTTIARQGDPCTQLIFLLNGEIMSQCANNERPYTFYEILDNPLVIEPYSLFGMHPYYTATYKAHTDINLVCIEKSAVIAQLNQYEIFRLNYLNILSNRVQVINNRLWNTHIGDTRKRIVNFLRLRSMRPEGEKRLHIKMEDLAHLIADTRINVSRVLNDMQEKGLVQLSRKEIFIPALENL